MTAMTARLQQRAALAGIRPTRSGTVDAGSRAAKSSPWNGPAAPLRRVGGQIEPIRQLPRPGGGEIGFLKSKD
jgi:hypothetical protein